MSHAPRGSKSVKRASKHHEHGSPVVGPSKPRLWDRLGPGLITGAADDDPSGIATYSQAGALFGFGLCWTMVVTYPLMVVIQAISARIGRTTGRGIAGNLRVHYPPAVLQGAVWLLFAANVCNIAADLGAMAEATQLVVPWLPVWMCLGGYGVVCTAGQVFMHHTRYVSVLKWLTLSLLAYFATLVVVHVAWREFVHGLFIPHVTGDRDFWMMVVAILGTTISPYLFFWQAAQEVEDTKTEPYRVPLRRRPAQGADALARINADTLVGMGVSNLVALAIMATTASTLHVKGSVDIAGAAQAAAALEPFAGRFAAGLFALGIIGTGLLAVPVLAGSAAYAIGEAQRWPVGLARQPREAKAFYAVIAAATALGAIANFASISPIKALVWSAVVNAITAVPIMVILMRMACNHKIMGKFCITRPWKVVGWVATAVMAVASAAFLATLF